MEIIKLNLIPSGATPVVHVKQYDIGRKWRFELYEGAAVYTLDGTEVLECDVKKLDGNIVTISVTNTSSTYVDIETTVQMTACSGDQIGALRITKGGDDIATINFILACQRSPLEGGITSDSAIHNLEQQIADAVADQYDADSVIFDNTPTTGHGIGYAVTSDGLKSYIPKNVSDMDDVTITTPVAGEALVFDADGNLVNGTVSTVGNLDDLSDVDTTGKATGDSLRYDGAEWVAKPTTIEMTQAEYNAIVDFTPYANTHIVITDAPNLNPTASDIEYSSGVTVKQAIDGKVNTTDTVIHLANKYLSSACQWFTTNLGQNTNTMVISTTDNLATNNSIHILLFGRYGAWVVRASVDGTGNFSSAEITKLESGANTVTASVSGKNITLTGLGTWSTFLGVIVKDYYQTVTFTISQS